jgi:hypothetical protein
LTALIHSLASCELRTSLQSGADWCLILKRLGGGSGKPDSSLTCRLPQLFWPRIIQQEFQSQQNSVSILNRTLDEFLSASRQYHLDCRKLTQQGMMLASK